MKCMAPIFCCTFNDLILLGNYLLRLSILSSDRIEIKLLPVHFHFSLLYCKQSVQGLFFHLNHEEDGQDIKNNEGDIYLYSRCTVHK